MESVMKSGVKLTVTMKAWVAAVLLLCGLTQVAKAEEEQTSILLGPSIHLALGIRMKKAPDLDTYYSTVGGVKISLLGIQAGQNMYFSFLAPGLQYGGYGLFVPSFSPVIFNSNVGLGFAFDFFPVRDDRAGGPIGMSFNVDVPRVIRVLQGG